MAARKRKQDPAALRTISLFSGKTVIEEAEHLLEVDAADLAETQARAIRTGHPFEMVHEAEDAAVRWLGLDVFHEGDDLKVAVHPKGHAVLVLVRTTGTPGLPYGTATIKLSRAQWAKLKTIARGEG
jgi:hypothetical protein